MQKQINFSSIAVAVRSALRRLLWPLAILAGIKVFVLFLNGSPAAVAFLLIATSSLAALFVWAKQGAGLPMFALLAAQNLVIYGLPIAVNNPAVLRYPEEFLTRAGWELFVFNFAMIGAWRTGMTVINPSPSICYALLGLDSASPKLTRLGITLLISGSAYEVLNSAGIVDLVESNLPAGSNSIIHALMSAASGCGFFLCGMMVGKGQATQIQRTLFWTLLALQCLLTAAGFLLSAAIFVVFASVIGLFWGSGRLPWRLIVVVAVACSFFNLGKFIMREKYWTGEDGEQNVKETSLGQMPSVYREWAEVSFDILTGNAVATQQRNAFSQFGSIDQTKVEGQSLLDRVNNLENLLYVIDVMQTSHLQPLGGATYAVIPPLLVPRILWPNKPRTHEGQILLNVYFGRQDMSSTFHTYIAWGLLPEAYGNFGPIAGALVLGVFIGFLFAWIERFVANKLVLSLEGFLSFTLFLGIANSYEMVASVLVTSLFQGFVPIVIASMPFVERITPKKTPSDETASASSH